MIVKERGFILTKKDFKIVHFRAGGPGGQKQNKTSSATRITHIETGISAESREHREQPQNTKAAFEKLCNDPGFKLWQQKKLFEIEIGERELKRRVDKMMKPENLKVEYYDITNKINI